MVQKVFNRVEKKYLMDEKTFNLFKKDLDLYMSEDEYGLHTIRNIYYDTDDNELIRTSIEKPVYKEKFRVRCYGNPDLNSVCFLEIKKKYEGIVNKRRISLPMKEAYAYLEQGIVPSKTGQIFNEIDYFLKHYNIKPKRYLAYDRIAMFGKEDHEFRVTFDANIRSRTHNLDLRDDEENEMLLPDGYRLMEVKILGGMPLWFVHLLSKYEVYPVSFSKYGSFYKNQLKAEQIERKQKEFFRIENSAEIFEFNEVLVNRLKETI